MKVLEFEAQIPADGTLKIPSKIVAEFKTSDRVRVVLVAADSPEDDDWERLGAEEFLAGYSEGDAVYDQFSAR